MGHFHLAILHLAPRRHQRIAINDPHHVAMLARLHCIQWVRFHAGRQRAEPEELEEEEERPLHTRNALARPATAASQSNRVQPSVQLSYTFVPTVP